MLKPPSPRTRSISCTEGVGPRHATPALPTSCNWNSHNRYVITVRVIPALHSTRRAELLQQLLLFPPLLIRCCRAVWLTLAPAGGEGFQGKSAASVSWTLHGKDTQGKICREKKPSGHMTQVTWWASLTDFVLHLKLHNDIYCERPVPYSPCKFSGLDNTILDMYKTSCIQSVFCCVSITCPMQTMLRLDQQLWMRRVTPVHLCVCVHMMSRQWEDMQTFRTDIS